MSGYKYKTTLLVDDSYIDNLINRKILENNNFSETITVIDSPQLAIQHIRESVSSGTPLPEVLFLDLRMPEMSGFDFLTELDTIENLPIDQVKIYILSSSLDPTDLKKVEENKLVTKFIGKPLSQEILEEI